MGAEIREMRKAFPGIGVAVASEMIEFYLEDLRQTESIADAEKISREIRMLLPEMQEDNG